MDADSFAVITEAQALEQAMSLYSSGNRDIIKHDVPGTSPRTIRNRVRDLLAVHRFGQWARAKDGSALFHYTDGTGSREVLTKAIPDLPWDLIHLYRADVPDELEGISRWRTYVVQDDVYHSFSTWFSRMQIPVVARDGGYYVVDDPVVRRRVPCPLFLELYHRDWLAFTQHKIKTNKRVVVTHDDFWSTIEVPAIADNFTYVHVDMHEPFVLDDGVRAQTSPQAPRSKSLGSLRDTSPSPRRTDSDDEDLDIEPPSTLTLTKSARKKTAKK